MDPFAPTDRCRRVLVVDGDWAAARPFIALLRGRGHRVWAVVSVPEALEAAGLLRPDVILLAVDLLGGGESDDVARRLRERCGEKRPLLVAVGGAEGVEALRRCGEAGFDCALLRPAAGSEDR